MKMAARTMPRGAARMKYARSLADRQGSDLPVLECGGGNARDFSPETRRLGGSPLPFAKLAVGDVMFKLKAK